MTSQVLNFLWLNLELLPPPDPGEGLIREPMPTKYIENIRKAGERHPHAEIDLWVDSKRLTENQLAYLKQATEGGMQNVHVKDLRYIPAYRNEPLYDKAEKNPDWRDTGQRALIWRQVDAAKVLVSLVGNFDQTFFADLDHAHLDIASMQVQGMLKKHGMFIGSRSSHSCGVENQLWGFNRTRRKFFQQYYAMALLCARLHRNAWNALDFKVWCQLKRKEKIPSKEIILPIDDDGSRAEQPGSQLQKGNGQKAKPSLISIAFDDAGRAKDKETSLGQIAPKAPAAAKLHL